MRNLAWSKAGLSVSKDIRRDNRRCATSEYHNMSGDSSFMWLSLVGGMLLQLTYMILPLQRWDWARYLGSAAAPLFVLAKANNDHAVISPSDGLFLCGLFTFMFTLLFQSRLLPRLGEGAILMWTAVLLCVTVEIGAWESVTTYLVLGVGIAVLGLLMTRQILPYLLKLGVYVWFLLAVVAIGVLQFHRSDLSLIIAGGSGDLDYRFALIDGAAGAYIGVHAAFLFEMLPIPGKGESWKDFKSRWTGYLDLIASRLDDQRLSTRVGLMLVLGILTLAYVNHAIEFLPDRTLVYLVLLGLPIVWRAVWLMSHRRDRALAGIPSPADPTGPSTDLHTGIGRARHSKKHRQE